MYNPRDYYKEYNFMPINKQKKQFDEFLKLSCIQTVKKELYGLYASTVLENLRKSWMAHFRKFWKKCFKNIFKNYQEEEGELYILSQHDIDSIVKFIK